MPLAHQPMCVVRRPACWGRAFRISEKEIKKKIIFALSLLYTICYNKRHEDRKKMRIIRT